MFHFFRSLFSSFLFHRMFVLLRASFFCHFCATFSPHLSPTLFPNPRCIPCRPSDCTQTDCSFHRIITPCHPERSTNQQSHPEVVSQQILIERTFLVLVQVNVRHPSNCTQSKSHCVEGLPRRDAEPSAQSTHTHHHSNCNVSPLVTCLSQRINSPSALTFHVHHSEYRDTTSGPKQGVQLDQKGGHKAETKESTQSGPNGRHMTKGGIQYGPRVVQTVVQQEKKKKHETKTTTRKKQDGEK